MFKDGHQLLDKKWGAINTIVLLISSFSMAWAVNAAQLSKRKLCVGLLGFTFACGVAFMCIKYVEYNHKFEMGVGPGKFFDEEFVRNDENWLQPDAHVDAVHDESDPDDHAPDPSPQDLALQRVRSTVVPAAIGPTGLAPPRTDDDHGGHGDSEHHYPRLTAAQVIGAKNYFNIYFGMTGLHGIHVLVGMGLILWILRRAARNEFSAAYYTPVDLVGLYWHLVDLIWIFLFPLLYLVT
ncbi:MAG: cytochrome oxidase subunit III [Planctomycetaceae bacterium]|nr:cytochrome oxidase subunit III [Planctomycetaceae bacterium]